MQATPRMKKVYLNPTPVYMDDPIIGPRMSPTPAIASSIDTTLSSSWGNNNVANE